MNSATAKTANNNAMQISTSIGNFSSVQEFTKAGLTEVIQATKSINSYPSGTSRDLYCAYPTFGKIIDIQSDRILGIISKVLKQQHVKGNIQRRQSDEQFEMLLECNDIMLERINSNLDEIAGIKKNPQTIIVETNLNNLNSGYGAGSWNTKAPNSTSPVSARLITARNVARPQIKFKVPIDNSSTAPFVPKIKEKPNSLKPLAILPEYDDDGNLISYNHPYEFELLRFNIPQEQLKRKNPVFPKQLEDIPLVYIDTVWKLKTALDEIRKFKEIAIDVEHHSYRTFQGITCLVQISTREKDYICDALELRDDMHILNEVFTNPKIVKIFHGAQLDIEWLQRDLSLYIVNMFDTHQASKALNMSRLSLSYLLKHYCNIDIDKTYQLADWRIRPLPEELISYARQDTHYLIYIYESVTNALLDLANGQTNILEATYQRSTELCKRRYDKPIVTEESHIEFFRKSKRIFDNRQLFALRYIFQWRDTIARQEDESYGYVLPNHMMLQISESLPREMQGILACCNPIPPLVRQNLHTLHQIVLKARDQPLIKPIIQTDATNRTIISNTKDYNSKLYCPHDLSHVEEFRDDLPTLLTLKNKQCKGQNNQIECDVKNDFLLKPVISLFNESEFKMDEEKKRKIEKLKNIQFISPYDRYLVALPMIEQEKREEAARIEAENRKKLLCPIVVRVDPATDKAINTAEDADTNDMYSVPLKEFLKRKYEESVAKKNSQNSTTYVEDSPPKKKLINITPTDDKMSFDLTVESNTKNDIPDPVPSEEVTCSQVNNQQQHINRPPQPNSKNSKKKKSSKFKNSKKQSNQCSDKPVRDFDYSSVDWNRFKGGGGKSVKGHELTPRFYGKGNSSKANNKKFNKMFTFSNAKNKK